ncbi:MULTISPECIES: hypothetical protein [Methylorubrum]|jgi:hypothetical protein|uniref:Uncharacterized protein n=1 Tax=Methylorubrum populi TaxID=223967 RepID=A0A514KPE6_9HYPH|nr:hypothetical protein [Methylorubrum populi]KAB7784866.1 hypothetical protein F8B43_2899 [Methylorubrum populi]QDI81488.1 hypothetical protein E8E01_14060 [Methylorubrum populi]
MKGLTIATAALAAATLSAGPAAAFGAGGGSSGEGDGYLRQELQNPGYIEPSPYAYRNGYRPNDPGAEYEARRRGYPIYGQWGWKYR